MNWNAPEDVQLPKLEPLNCCLFSLSATMVTTLWLRQPASLCSACIRSLFKWVKDKLWERLFCVGLESNFRNIDSGQTISQKNLLMDYQSRILIQLKVFVVSEEKVTASEPDWNSITCCISWARFWAVDTTSNSSTCKYTCHDCARKSKYTPMRTDLSREHIAFKLSCMVHCKNNFS